MAEYTGRRRFNDLWDCCVAVGYGDERGDDGLFFIFCRGYDDWTQAPRETRLQRALLDLYCGGMVFLREDLGRFGEQVYRGSLL